MTIKAINPASGEIFESYEEAAPEAVNKIIGEVNAAFLDWRRVPIAERAVPMRRAAEILRAEAHDHARLMAREMGKPVRDGIAEAQKCATGCDYYADNAERLLQRETVPTEARSSFVTFNPLGVVLAVMPWNFPFWQVFRFAAPGLMAGNAAVLKHASNVPGCALAIEDIFRRAGFPTHLFRTLMIGSKRVGAVIEHPLVRAVTVTGSGAAGRAVAAKAGEMLKKTVLELGGSDPYLILEDAELGADVGIHAAVTVEMVGGQVQHHRHPAVQPVNVLELEARELAGDPDVVADPAGELRQRPADVAGDLALEAARAQHRPHQMRGGRLAVGACDTCDRVWQHPCGELDLAPHGYADGACGYDLGNLSGHAGALDERREPVHGNDSAPQVTLDPKGSERRGVGVRPRVGGHDLGAGPHARDRLAGRDARAGKPHNQVAPAHRYLLKKR